ncbi:uncharacterized protein LOC131844532 [Achroia grisella]|uniref:uncharacterized protein LOC131844532 n=1 Tax=Achroia grisella TaxID=688607 RepID=UPI0027D34C36|nr:uncharacterized protein LOC131844532 [Achroia grisella]
MIRNLLNLLSLSKSTFVIFVLSMNEIIGIIDEKDYRSSIANGNSHIEVRAVFINCRLDESQGDTGDGVKRFQLEQLFKYNVLSDCEKKLALTVKLSSDPSQNFGIDDEYIPIEHVFDGSNKKRVRLLNPYVLRLRREKPLQAYKIRRLDTVSGIIINSDKENAKNKSAYHTSTSLSLSRQNTLQIRHRVRRNNNSLITDKQSESMGLDCQLRIRSNSVELEDWQFYSTASAIDILQKIHKDVNAHEVGDKSATLKRDKRQEHNILVEHSEDDSSWGSDIDSYKSIISEKDYKFNNSSVPYTNRYFENKRNAVGENYLSELYSSDLPMSQEYVTNKIYLDSNLKMTRPASNNLKFHEIEGSTQSDRVTIIEKCANYNNLKANEKEFALFEIDNPDLWNTIHVQLLEKRSTPEGKTVWNDITKGEPVSIGSLSSQWTNKHMHVQYRLAKWIPREDFSLPSTSSLRLFVPLSDNDREYIIIPMEDVLSSDEDEHFSINPYENMSDFAISNTQNKKRKRRVLVHVSRQLLNVTKDSVNILDKTSELYLTLPYRKPHQAQIDLEAKADENQLILVGCSGRITTVVADSSRLTRTILTIQATNTGLAAARFRVKTRNCDPDLENLLKDVDRDRDGYNEYYVVLAPMYTKQFRLELPIDIPVDVTHCSVALMNDDEETVAIRDVTIKKGDRCFCVWYCDCVCMSEDPRLLCREMSDSKRVAAGILASIKSRQVRSVCYPDVVYLNLCVITVGVLIALWFLGFLKASVGLVFRSVGAWGLDRLLLMPRKLEHYYENSLRDRPVVYDEQGWPVHPDTKLRTVRLINKWVEFILNMIIFIVAPCLIVWDTLKHIASQWHKLQKNTGSKSQNMNTKKCFSTQDLQGLERRWRYRRGGLRRWMTPQAEDLSTDIWCKGLTSQRTVNGIEFMRPLLRQENQTRPDDTHSSCVDSEQDDTEYVLMQMQKSRESLARIQSNSNVKSMSTRKQNEVHCSNN